MYFSLEEIHCMLASAAACGEVGIICINSIGFPSGSLIQYCRLESNPCLGDAVISSPRAASSRRVADRDRKSTRLNSSHLVISYAVFCLKKKKKKKITSI